MSNTVSPIDGTAYFGVKAAAPKSELNMDTFLKLLVTQLQNQNPLEPMNDRDFFAQMAQLGTVQGLEKMQDSMDVQQASEMMGKIVTAYRPMTESSDGYDQIITGVVEKVIIKNGEQYIGIADKNGGIVEVKTTQILNVKSAPSVTDGAALIGRTVSGTITSEINGAPAYFPVTGQVTGVKQSSDGLMLQVKQTNGNTVSLAVSAVTSISQ